jgi:hypothetical protein
MPFCATKPTPQISKHPCLIFNATDGHTVCTIEDPHTGLGAIEIEVHGIGA